MRFTSLCLLALPLFASAVPSPFQITVEASAEEIQQLLSANNAVKHSSDEVPTFIDHRIRHYPDKVLLHRLRAFFKTFTTGDFDGMEALQSKDYTMTNIHFGVVRATREEWYQGNKGLTNLVHNMRVVALNLSGSSKPGQHSMLEHISLMELSVDPPPQLADKFPDGAKKGDTVGIVNLCILWWDEHGLIKQEFEYGGLMWENFSEHQWDRRTPSGHVLVDL